VAQRGLGDQRIALLSSAPPLMVGREHAPPLMVGREQVPSALVPMCAWECVTDPANEAPATDFSGPAHFFIQSDLKPNADHVSAKVKGRHA
jgi:hypothetical protein